MKLFTSKEVQEKTGDSIDGWANRAVNNGFKYLSVIDRFILPVTDGVNYYTLGKSVEDLHASASSLQYIDPEEGGSPKAFVNFIENGIEETKNMRLGTLLHLYHENRDKFVVSKILKPSEKAGDVADEIIRLVREGNIFCNEVVKTAILNIDYQSNWKMETRINKIIDLCGAYVDDVLTAQDNNQIYLTATEVEPIQRGIDSLEAHPVARNLTFYSNDDISNTISLKEMELIQDFNVPIKVYNNTLVKHTLKVKSKLDNVIIDMDNKVIVIVDLKSSINGGMRYTKQFAQRKVNRQLGLYKIQVMKWLKDNDFPLEEFKMEYYIISLQTTGLGECSVFRISELSVQDGIKDAKRLLQRIAYHDYTRQWKWSKEEIENGYIVDMPYVAES